MIQWYQNLSLTNQAVMWFLLLVYCSVMTLSLLSFLRLPYLGWSRGFQSTPIFQILMWLGALPFVVPLLFMYLRRRRAIHSSRFIGNLRSRIFHEPNCEYQLKINSNFIRFPLASLEDARSRKFRPCNWCNPK